MTTDSRNEEEIRRAFEEWIMSPLYDLGLDRFPNDEKQEWPGQYVDTTVQVAWEAWQEARKTL